MRDANAPLGVEMWRNCGCGVKSLYRGLYTFAIHIFFVASRIASDVRRDIQSKHTKKIESSERSRKSSEWPLSGSRSRGNHTLTKQSYISILSSRVPATVLPCLSLITVYCRGSYHSPSQKMEVLLYVYDLSQGMARQMSMQFLGIQIDAIYHTAIVLNCTEYFFGQGIQMCRAGMSHHGRPMQTLNLGQTDIPLEVIEDYLGALRETYSAASYDLFAHNCNHFSHDFAQFLVGRGIPDHITSLPRQVLNTPFGRMLQPQLDASLRSVTQASVPAHAVPNASQSMLARKTAQRLTHPHDESLQLLKQSHSNYTRFEEEPGLEDVRSSLDTEMDLEISQSIDWVSFRFRKDITINAPIPDVNRIFDRLIDVGSTASTEVVIATFTISRLLLLDLRISTFLAEQEASRHTLARMLQRCVSQEDASQLRDTAMILACNMFDSKPLRRVVLHDERLSPQVIDVTCQALLQQDNPTTQLLASALAANVSTAHFQDMRELKEDRQSALAESRQIELAVALIELLSTTSEKDCIRNVVYALGRLIYRAPMDGELLDICASLDAADLVREKGKMLTPDEAPIAKATLGLLDRREVERS